MRYCESCKTDYPDERKFCRRCGSPLIDKPAESAKSAPQSLQCPACGREATSVKKFCRYCGAPLSSAAPVATTPITGPVLCPGCGNEVTPSKKFCSRCGLQLIPEGTQTPNSRAMILEGSGVPGIAQPSPAVESVPPRAQASVVAAAAPGVAAVRLTTGSQSHQQSQALPENEE